MAPTPPLNITFQFPITNPFGLTPVANVKPFFADLDGDGDLDAFFISSGLYYYQNTGTVNPPAFATPTLPASPPFGMDADINQLKYLALVDLDGDSDLDFFWLNGGGTFFLETNTGNRTSPSFPNGAIITSFGFSGSGVSGFTFVDIDKDGDLDFFTGYGDGNTSFYRNTGNASFSYEGNNLFGLTNVGNSAIPNFVDIDGDLDLDAFISNGDGNTFFYLNTGNASSPSFAAPSTNPFGLTDVGTNARITLIDIDKDGDLDAFIGNSDGNTLFFLNGVAPTISFAFAANTINENTVIGAGIKIGDITITDPNDITNTNVLTVSDTTNFVIRGTELYFIGASPDFETTPSYSLTITSTDGAVTNSKDITINVNDVNEVPTNLTLQTTTTSLAENTNIASPRKVADITVTDDALGTNTLYLTGADASNFEILGTSLYLKANTALNYEAKASYNVIVNVDDTSVGNTPDQTTSYTLNVTNQIEVTIAAGTTPIEGVIVGTYTITLDTPAPTGGLVINFNTSGTATYSTDYTLSAGNGISAVTANSFTIAEGQTTATLNLNAVADNVGDFGETVQINLTSGTGYGLGQNSTPLLTPATNYSVGSNPIWVAVGDFNGDGKLDLATANRYGDSVSILLRNSDNTGFDAKTDYTVGNYPEWVAVGDFNGDGKQDLATANSSGNSVSILLRNSDNTGFDAKTDYTVDSPTSVAVGDFNGDGNLDLATANASSISVSILLRNSDNTGFDAKTDYTVGDSSTSVAVGDFNGDGKLDLATANFANYNGNSVSILLRNSANTGFDTKTDYTVGSAPHSVAVGDFNGDGKLDLATANYNGNSVSILLRNSANTGFDTQTDFSVGTNPRSLAVGDFNRDGKVDLATANAGSNSVSILLRNSANTGFDIKTDFSVGSLPVSVAVGDFNGDGKPDLANANYNDDSVSVLLNADPSTTLTITNGILGDNNSNEKLIGTSAPDWIEGRPGNDILEGGGGNDTIIGGTGTDTAEYKNAPTAVNIDLTTGLGTDGQGGTDTLTEIENVNGSDYGDLLTGNDQTNVLDGRIGNDTLNGCEGIDILIGGAGNNVLDGGTGIDTADYSRASNGVTVNLFTGTASNNGYGGTDTLTGIEIVYGSKTAGDSLTGNLGNNSLYGYGGADTLTGGGGNDYLYLGVDAVTDIVNYSSGDGSDTVFNFVRGVNRDRLNFTGIANIDVRVSGTSTQFRVGDGTIGDSGFGAGTLLLTTSATTGFVAGDVNSNLFGANFAFS